MNMNPAAKRIQALLDSRNEKLKTVAEAAGVGYYSIYPWWQRENSKPSYDNALKLANYFGVPVGHIMHGDPIDGSLTSPEAFISRISLLSDDDQNALLKYIDFLVESSDRK